MNRINGNDVLQLPGVFLQQDCQLNSVSQPAKRLRSDACDVKEQKFLWQDEVLGQQSITGEGT